MSVLVILAASFTVGVGFGLIFPTTPWAAAVCLAASSVVTAAAVFKGRCVAFSLISATFLVGWVRPVQETKSAISDPDMRQCVRVLQGRVTSPPTLLEERSRVALELDSISGCLGGADISDLKSASGRLYLTVMSEETIPYCRGDLVRFRAVLKPILHARNRGRPDRGRDEVYFAAVVDAVAAIALVDEGTPQLDQLFDAFRRELAAFWRVSLDADESDLARALTLGESQTLDYSVRESFRRTGTAHLLSVSGLHLGLAVLFVYLVLRTALIRCSVLAERLDVGRVAAVIAVPFAIGFTMLTGCRVPVVRACVMTVSALTARALGYTSGTVEALAIAGASLLAADPRTLFDPGFQLSFAAVLGFVGALGQPPQDRTVCLESSETSESRFVRFAVQIGVATKRLLRSTLTAAAATTPLVLYHFGYLSWVSVPANMIAVPLTGLLILPSLLILMTLSTFTPKLAGLLARPLGQMLDWLMDLLGSISRMPCTLENPGPVLFGAIVTGCLGILLLVARKLRFGAYSLVFSMLCAAASLCIDPPSFPKNELTVDFLDVGQGDSTLITFPDGRHWLVDAGGAWGGRFDVGERIVVPVLRSLGVRRIDKMILTHPDYDHVGGMPAVLDAFKVVEIWDNGQGAAEGADEAYRLTRSSAREQSIPIRETPGICGAHNVAGTQIRVVHPCGASGGYDAAFSFNNNSIVLVFNFGLMSLVLPGDIEAETESLLLERGMIGKTDILKLPHHGSRTSSTPAFLESLSPWLGVASVGRSRRRSILHRAVIQRLGQRSIVLKRTDFHGGIRLITDGRVVEISPRVPAR